MHIMEGFLPIKHAIGWSIVSFPFVVFGFKRLSEEMKKDASHKILLSSAGGFAFILSSLKIPSITGSSSHPTGIGLGSILYGPGIGIIIGFTVLLFQALLLAHGGLTTLGANVFSMAIVGSFVAYSTYGLGARFRLSGRLCIFFAAFFADMATYITTSIQLALAFPDPHSGIQGSLIKFMGIFSFTQIPLAISEGLLTVIVVNLLRQHAPPHITTGIPSLQERS